MEANEAIAIAKGHIAKMFAGELTSLPTLEEIWFDDLQDEWCVTIGLRRPGNQVIREGLGDLLSGKSRILPDLKVVRISNAPGKFPKIIDREAVSV